MIQGKYLSIVDDLSSILRIRKNVFEDELHVVEHMQIDNIDKESINVIVFDNQIEVGTGRIRLHDNLYTIDMVCVLNEYRNKGYGEFIVRLLADKAMLSGAKSIYLVSPASTVPFFEKLYFKTTTSVSNGDVTMILNMDDLVTPCGHACSKQVK